MFEVKVKPGHPTGTRHRAGQVFTVNGGVFLDAVPEEIASDPWLIVTESDGKAPAKQANAGGEEDLAQLLKALGAENVAEARQAVDFHLQFDETRDRELTQAKTGLAARDKAVADLQETVRVGLEGIDQLGKKIAERDVRIQDLEAALAEATKKKGGRGGSSD